MVDSKSRSLERQENAQKGKSGLWKGGTHSEFRERIIKEKESTTYTMLERRYNINRFYLHSVIHDEDFILPPLARRRARVTMAKKPKRATIYPGTPPEKIVKEIKRVTGRNFEEIS